MAASYVPTTKLLATLFRLAVTRATGPPGVNIPTDGETFNQDDVVATDQVRLFVPVLVKVKLEDDTVNGPPTPPIEVGPEFGVISNGSGFAKASINFWPAGVPQPVQRS